MIGSKKLPYTELTALAADVLRLSRLLTTERAALPASYLKDEGLRKAYLRYFLPSNLQKIHIPLRELSRHPNLVLARERLRLLDIGSGPGTALLGVLEFFSRQDRKPVLACTAVDQVAENLREAESLFEHYRKEHRANASLRTVQASVERFEGRLDGPFDLIILSNLLNELFPGDGEKIAKRTSTLKNILGRFLTDDGSCIVIEPALRETSREVLMVRDGLLKEGFSVYSPCLIGTGCPALAHPKDWCHEDVPWEPPEIVKEVDKRIGLRKDALKFSYLVLRKDSLSLEDVYGPNAFRVVSEPLISKGKREFYICGSGGRRLVTRLDKDTSPSNEAFGTLKRGDVLRFDNVADEGKRLKVGKDTSVRTTAVDRIPGPPGKREDGKRSLQEPAGE